jgi:hypothetical protein
MAFSSSTMMMTGMRESRSASYRRTDGSTPRQLASRASSIRSGTLLPFSQWVMLDRSTQQQLCKLLLRITLLHAQPLQILCEVSFHSKSALYVILRIHQYIPYLLRCEGKVPVCHIDS